jgi:hypothetical protein
MLWNWRSELPQLRADESFLAFVNTPSRADIRELRKHYLAAPGYQKRNRLVLRATGRTAAATNFRESDGSMAYVSALGA